MNWLDITLLIVFVLVTGFSTWELIRTWDYGYHIEICAPFIVAIILAMWLFVFDWKSGVTVGTLTSIDQNFFGTTALYIKTSETAQEKYCIEDENVAEQAKSLVGEKVVITYGKRVGLYSTAACRQSPVETIKKEE